MKAISIQQPWAWAIFHGKTVENRSWGTDYRGELLIHASSKFDKKGFQWIKRNFPGLLPADFSYPFFIPSGALIGKTTMTDCVITHSSAWFSGPYGFVFIKPVEFKKIIPFKGSLKFFDVPDKLIVE
jgi:hypothetical protein